MKVYAELKRSAEKQEHCGIFTFYTRKSFICLFDCFQSVVLHVMGSVSEFQGCDGRLKPMPAGCHGHWLTGFCSTLLFVSFVVCHPVMGEFQISILLQNLKSFVLKFHDQIPNLNLRTQNPIKSQVPVFP